MHVLMIGHLTGKGYSELLEEEGKFMGKARADGIVGDVYLKVDQTGPILLLPNTTADQAREEMAGLPFIVHDIATFDYIEVIDPPAGLPGTK